jgi:hypothetical protein
VLLRPFIIVPKSGFALLGFQRLDLTQLLFAVKETSINGQRVS